jgi:hypothetical protein
MFIAKNEVGTWIQTFEFVNYLFSKINFHSITRLFRIEKRTKNTHIAVPTPQLENMQSVTT